MIFEGEYLNGERWNGKGQEYEDERFIFDGEYLNGKKWKGKYKDYINISRIILEGEYLNGEINGNGKEYYNN